MEVGLYSILGFRADGISVAAEVVPAATHEQAKARARAFLRDHPSCETVEIFALDANEKIAVVERASDAHAV